MTEIRSFILLLATIAMAACSGGPARVDSNSPEPAFNAAQPEQSPKAEGTVTAESPPVATDASKVPSTKSQGFTEADLEKIKWLEGTWRGSYKTSQFFQRISFKGARIMIETFTDGTLTKKGEPASFELKNGELTHSVGADRWKAVSVSEDAVHFVPADPPKPGENIRASFKFERQPGETWRAILDTPETATKPPLIKVYKMEPWSAPAK